MSVDIWTLVIVILIVISIVVTITSSYISGKMENEHLKAHFDKLSEDYYKDNEETTFHVPISFFISSVSTVSFFTVIALFVAKNKAFFTENIPFIEKTPYVGISFFYIILIFMFLIIVHEFSISFGRLAVTIGKRTKKAATALVLIIWMFVILGIALIASIALSNYWK
ncbi:hypothetical protein L2737_21905 [Shewanella electrodiphila]|uniref:Yip1 domain-containing protein n=1 Tax=Shewanella electrodiphila TaxID=934143 RepID=A0ABT0KVT4_9GAMM|nr:hypothetical protein [Shewanella electrodiphila]MCL1047958.1 hypothetical protein [Shewanella electrodiphila]